MYGQQNIKKKKIYITKDSCSCLEFKLNTHVTKAEAIASYC